MESELNYVLFFALRHVIELSKHDLDINAKAIRLCSQFVRIPVCFCNSIPEHSIFLLISAWHLQQLFAGLSVIEYDGFFPSRVLGDGVRDNETRAEVIDLTAFLSDVQTLCFRSNYHIWDQSS
jgi:hypothetical protein